MARFGDGLALGPDLSHAATSAVAQALAPLGTQRPDLLCIFVSGDDPAAVETAGYAAMEASGATMTLGCSAEGVIGDGRGVELTGAVSAWAAVLPGIRMTPFHLRRSPDGGVSGMPERRDDDAVAVTFAEPTSFPVDAFVERVNRTWGGLPVVGGLVSNLAGEGHRLFLQGRAVDAGAVGVLLGGDVHLRTIVSQGSRPVGPPMTVTRADDDIIHELAGRPALTKLEEVVAELPDEDRELVRPALLLGIAMDEYTDQHERGDFLVRSVVGADAASGSVAIVGPVALGRTVRLHVRDAGTATADMDQLFARLQEESGFGTAEGALLFSCNGRGTILFPTADHDVQAVRSGLGATGVGGFFAAGEIGPVAGRNHLHGFTASILAFGESSTPEGKAESRRA